MGISFAFMESMAKNHDNAKTDAERFELRDAPGTAGKTIGTFPTREAADEALRQNQQNSPGVSFSVVDTGPKAVPETPEARTEAIENGKTAEQKRIEEDQKKERVPSEVTEGQATAERASRRPVHA